MNGVLIEDKKEIEQDLKENVDKMAETLQQLEGKALKCKEEMNKIEREIEMPMKRGAQPKEEMKAEAGGVIV